MVQQHRCCVWAGAPHSLQPFINSVFRSKLFILHALHALQALQACNVCECCGLASINQRASAVAFVMYRRRHAVCNHLPQCVYCCFNEATKFGCNRYLTPPAAGGVINSAERHSNAQHFFKKHCLRRELNIIVDFLALAPVLELNGKHRAAGMKLHHIGLADQPQPIRPQGQCALNLHPSRDLVTGRIDEPMRRLPARGVNVIVEYLLHVNQRTLTRAIRMMLERGDSDGVGVVHAGGATISLQHNSIAGDIMGAILKEIEAQALQLTPKERGELAHRLIVSLDGEPADSPEAIAKAWDEEIARRVADMDAGRTAWIPADEVFKEIDAIIAGQRR